MKRLLLCAALLVLTASTAAAGGINLSWTDCGSFGTQDRTFACNSNVGSNKMVASFDPTTDLPDFSGNEVHVEIISSTASLPQWWLMGSSTSCRGAIPPSFSATFGTSCADNFQGSGFGGGTYTVSAGGATVDVAWGFATGIPITAGTEYYALNIFINNSKSVGTGHCAGCSQGVCIILDAIDLAYGPSATLTQTITNPLQRNWITWQNNSGIPCPAIVPIQNRTWGQMKSLYR
jgi:hypothetical protein